MDVLERRARAGVRNLGCELLKVAFDLRSRVALLYVPEGHCTDMTGACAYCQTRFPTVRSVHVVSGDELLNVYHFDGHSWECVVSMPRNQ